MTLQQFEYVLAVSKIGNFARAAESCGVTQPTLSTMIQKLEDELGTKIFDRSSQPIRPTAIGRMVIDQAQTVLHQARRVKDIVMENRNSLSGTFTLGILPSIAPYLLPRFFPVLRKKYPDLNIRVVEMKTADIKKALSANEIDAAIVALLPDMDEYHQTTLFYEQFYAYVSHESRLFANELIRTSDIGDEELWLLDEGHCFRDQLLRFCQMKSAQQSQTTYSLGTIETFMRIVESGRGLTFIPALAVEQLSETQRQLVRPFAIPRPTRHIVMLSSKDCIRTSVIDTLTKEVRSSVPADMLTFNQVQTII